MKLYEDVLGPLGDDPQDPELYRREAHPVEERPTKAEAEADLEQLDWEDYIDEGGYG